MLPMLDQPDQTVLPVDEGSIISGMTGLIYDYAYILVVAFVVSLLVTPIVRMLAFRIDAVDRPDFERKAHSKPVAYMGLANIYLQYSLAPTASLKLGTTCHQITWPVRYWPGLWK